jgi:hypothetical protein
MTFVLSGVFWAGALPTLPVFIFLEDISWTAERPDWRNCSRASLLRRTRGANSPAKAEQPGWRRRRLSAASAGGSIGDLYIFVFLSFRHPYGSGRKIFHKKSLAPHFSFEAL